MVQDRYSPRQLAVDEVEMLVELLQVSEFCDKMLTYKQILTHFAERKKIYGYDQV